MAKKNEGNTAVLEEKDAAGGVGRFNPAEPWPNGSVIRCIDGTSITVNGIDAAKELMTITGGAGKQETITIAEWNEEYLPVVEEVIFPEAVKPAREKAPPAKSGPAPRPDFVMVPIDRIDATHNIRTDIGEASLLQLQESIKDVGLLQPVIVRKISAKEYRLISGHRRLEAAKRAGEEFIEAKLYATVDDVWEAKARLAENVQRQDLNHIELAKAFGDAATAGLTVYEIAGQAHLSDDMVRRHLALLRLTKPVADLVAKGKLPVHQGELIARVGDVGKQISLTERCLALGWDSKKGTWTDRPAFSWHEGDPKDFIMPLEDLRKEVGYAMCGLAACGWLKQEAGNQKDGKKEGFAGQRQCEGCPDNTMTYADQPTLFAGIRPQGSGKKGYCTNPACYEIKSKEWEKIAEKRRKEQEKEQAVKITKARKAGLEVCERCGKVADAGESFEKNKETGSKLCDKCAAKLKKQAARYGQSRPERPFPQNEAEKLAVAISNYARAVLEKISAWACNEKGTDKDVMAKAWELLALQSAEGACWDRGYNENTFSVNLTFLHKHFPKPGELAKLLKGSGEACGRQPGLLPSLAEMRFPAMPNYESWNDRVVNVPIPPKALVFLDCLEAFCKRHGIKIPDRPTEKSIAAAVKPTEQKKPAGKARTKAKK